MAEAGAVLLRGLPLTDAAPAEAFVAGLGYTHMSYQPFHQPRKKARRSAFSDAHACAPPSHTLDMLRAAPASRRPPPALRYAPRAPRRATPFDARRPLFDATQVGGLDAATNIAGAALLDVHNEMGYNPRPAARILLVCLRPAAAGGESLVAGGAAVAAAVPGWAARRFEERALRRAPPFLAPPPGAAPHRCSREQRRPLPGRALRRDRGRVRAGAARRARPPAAPPAAAPPRSPCLAAAAPPGPRPVPAKPGPGCGPAPCPGAPSHACGARQLVPHARQLLAPRARLLAGLPRLAAGPHPLTTAALSPKHQPQVHAVNFLWFQ
jgi:hypothetical protein